MPSVAHLRALPPVEHLTDTPGPLTLPQQTLSRMPADSASECTSTDRCRRKTTRLGRLKAGRRRQLSPPPRPRPKWRQSWRPHGGDQDHQIDEGRRVGRPQPQPGGSRPLLGPRSCPEAQGRHRVALYIPTDSMTDGRTADRSEESQGAASLAYSFSPT